MLIRRLAAALAALLIANPAHAWIHGSAALPPAPDVLPGLSQPNTDPALNTYNTITPVYHGSSADTVAYNARGFARWNDVPFREVGQTGVSETRHIGLVAAHTATDTEKAAGLVSNISSVKVRCDGGSYFTISTPTVNPDADGVTDWNFTVTSSNFADGWHKCDAVVQPATGADIIMEGPSENAEHYDMARTYTGIIGDGAAYSGAGNILKVDAPPQNWQLQGTNIVKLVNGWSVSGVGVMPATFIDGTSTVNPTSCVAATGANCSGAGFAGTYHVKAPAAQLVKTSTFTGAISGSTLTVSAISAGNFVEENLGIAGAGVLPGQYIVNPKFEGSTAGNTLTVTWMNNGGRIAVGQTLNGCGVTGTPTITALGTGAGGTGTYTFSGSPQTIGACTGWYATLSGAGGTGTYPLTLSQSTVTAESMVTSTPMVMGNQRSFYFLTDYNGTLGRGTHIIYASLSGSDSNSGASAASPVLNPLTAAGKITANDSGATKKGKWGGTVCLMDGGYWTTFSGTGSIPDTSLGFLVWQSADKAPCVHPGDAGNAKLHFDVSNRIYGSQNVWYKSILLNGVPDTFNGGDSTRLVADHVTGTSSLLFSGGLLGSNAYACLGSTGYYAFDGGCNGAILARANVMKYYGGDGFHGIDVALNNVVDGGGPVLMWTDAAATSGSPVITGVSVAGGGTLTQLLQVGGGMNVWDPTTTGSGLGYCFPGSAVISSWSDAAHTITMDQNATINCAASHLAFPGVHGDMIQLQNSAAWSDIYISGNQFNPTYPSVQQGLFLEAWGESGVYVGNNLWRRSAIDGVESGILTNGLFDHVFYERNTYDTNNFRSDNLHPSNDQTWLFDQCLQGGTPISGAYYPSGTNQRRTAAAVNACYTTTTP